MDVLVGIDVQPVSEVASSMREFGERYTHRLFTDHELTTCGEDPVTSASSLAARFAAKEAVLKVLDSPSEAIAWKAIEVRRSTSRGPVIVLNGHAAEVANAKGITKMSLSMSHGGDTAAATVVALVSSVEDREDS